MCDARLVLLLNSTFEPLRFISESRAIKLLLKNKAESIHNWGSCKISSVSLSIETPSVLRLSSYVKIHRTKTRFNKKIVYHRDKYTCQYCGKQLTPSNVTIDHVLPRSRGGRTTWKNCVTCCVNCNVKKSNKTLDQLNDMRLLSQPRTPDCAVTALFTAEVEVWNDVWSNFVTK